MKILTLISLFLCNNLQGQTKIGWNQTHISGTDDFYVDYCDGCYAEFGFQSQFFENIQQFYFFKKDSKDEAKLFFIGKEIEYVESFSNWNIYYLNGISINKLNEMPDEKEFVLMLQNSTIQQWQTDTIPSLIQLFPIDSTNNYPVYTFEPIQQIIDTNYSCYLAHNQRAVDLSTKKDDINKTKFTELDNFQQFNLTFYYDFIEFNLNGNKEVWFKERKNKIYRNGSWYYQLHTTQNDSIQLKFKFPPNFTWKDAQHGDLNSLQMWNNQVPHILSEFIFELQ
ncbi:MAG: hypothetical protein ACC656_12330 [Candidatus Heimdallarchaeota archaeon]